MNDTRQAWFEGSSLAAELRHTANSPSQARVKRRISELRRSLQLAETKVARYRAALEALSLSLRSETPSPWADFRIRLHVGKLWLGDIERKNELALAARAAIASRCNTEEKALLFAAPAASEKQHLQRALNCGTLLCARAQAQAACQTLLATYLKSNPRLVRLRC